MLLLILCVSFYDNIIIGINWRWLKINMVKTIDKEKNSKNRVSYNTTINPDLINKAKMVKAHLLLNGIKKDGVNELIEEGLEVILKKYKKEFDIDEINL